MIKKKYKLILLGLISLIIMVDKCYAKIGYGVPNHSIHNGGYGGGEEEQPHDDVDGWKPSGASSNYKYTCEYDYNIYASSTLEIDMLNNQNKSIVTKKNGKIVFSEEVKAGTSTKVNITEIKTRWYTIGTITATYKRKGTYETCKTHTSNCKYKEYHDYGIFGGWKEVNWCNTTNSNCKRECETYEYCTEHQYPTHEYIASDPGYKSCKAAAEKEMKDRIDSSMSPSYTVKIQNPNYINAGIPKSDASAQKRIVYEIKSASSYCETQDNGKKCTFTYLPKAVCMNVKTAKVTYRNSDDCIEDEIEIKKETISNQKYWNYFVPLDTKEDSTFNFSMVRSSQDDVQSVNFCKALMEQNPEEYKLFIKTVNDLPLTGNFNQDLLTIEGNNGVNDGCILSTDLKMPTAQEFYNEVDKNILTDGSKYKFDGFNFYYKPIDINNPFPNGLATTSLWNNWNKSTTKKPNLSNSFNDITYTTQIDEKTIREYNEDNQYTNWTNMEKDGSSSFIESKGIITRNVDKNSFYKLGCGPYNQNWKECKKS